MRKKIVRPCNMAYAVRTHRAAPTWERVTKLYVNPERRQILYERTQKTRQSHVRVCVRVIYSGIHKRVYFFSSCWTSHCLTTFPCSWPKTNLRYIYYTKRRCSVCAHTHTIYNTVYIYISSRGSHLSWTHLPIYIYYI